MQESDLLWAALETFFPKKKDLASILDLPKSLKYSVEEQVGAFIKARDWLIRYNLYEPQRGPNTLSHHLWFKDPRTYSWPYADQTQFRIQVGVGKTTCFIGHLLIMNPDTVEKILSKNTFNPRKIEHLWIMGLLNIIEDRPPDLNSLLYSLRTKKSIKNGWTRIKENLELGRVDIWDFTFFTSILSQYHHKRDPIEARSNKGRLHSRQDTPRPIAALDHLTLSKAAMTHILEWLSQTDLSLTKKETLAKGVLENFLLQAHLKPHLPCKPRGRKTHQAQQQERDKAALHMLDDAKELINLLRHLIHEIDTSPHEAKIKNMERHVYKSKEPLAELDQNLARISPHFEVFYYLYESHRGVQQEKWQDWMKRAEKLLNDDAEGLIMYGPLLARRRQQLMEKLR